MTTDPWPLTADLRHRQVLEVNDAAAQIERSVGMLAEGAARPAMRWYSARSRALILGVFQPPELINRDACKARSIPVLQRRSGGTGVLVGPDFLSLDIALPHGHPLAPADVTETYRWLGQTWLAALSALGVIGARLVSIAEVRSAPPYRPLRRLPEGEISDEDLVRLACFGSLSPYETAVGARKLVGLSQVRRRGGVLLQAGLPLTFRAGLLAELLAVRSIDRERLDRLLRARAVGLDELLPALPPTGAIIAAFERALTADGRPLLFDT
ncbi:MAG: lipoate--protein ligase family protein [Chloroflexia bacterium]